MTGVGHKDQFPRPRLSARFGFRKETIAGVRHNGRDAPIADLRVRGEGFRFRPRPCEIVREAIRSRTGFSIAFLR